MGRAARLALGWALSGAFLLLIGVAVVSTALYVDSPHFSGNGLEMLYLDLLALPWSLLLPFILHDPPVAESSYVAVLAIACMANWALVTWWGIRRLSAGTRIPAGWYSDQGREDQDRYWDGSTWTDKLRPARRQRLGYDLPVLRDPVFCAVAVGCVASLAVEILNDYGPSVVLWGPLAAVAWLGIGTLVGTIRGAIRDSRSRPA